MFREQWLRKKITVAEAEAAHLVTDDRLGPDPVPFGFQNKRWRTLLSLMRAGDELWGSRPSRKASTTMRAAPALL